MIKDRHLHCGLSQHLLSPKEMLAGAYLGHRVLLPRLFELKKTCLTGDGRDERNENESRAGGLGFRMRPRNPQKTLCSLPRGGESLLRKKKPGRWGSMGLCALVWMSILKAGITWANRKEEAASSALCADIKPALPGVGGASFLFNA